MDAVQKNVKDVESGKSPSEADKRWNETTVRCLIVVCRNGEDKILIFATLFYGDLLEWLKRHAWKVCILLKGIEGSNPSVSANVKWLYH